MAKKVVLNVKSKRGYQFVLMLNKKLKIKNMPKT